MHIDGSHMNHIYQQKLADRYGHRNSGRHHGWSQGRALGHLRSPAKNGLVGSETARSVGRAEEMSLGDVFAQEMIRRMDPVVDENGEAKDTTALKNSLASTMDWVRQRFGDETGAAAAGMILQATNSGVTEETLGNGLLNVLKFIDRNFGTNAGDEAITKFNTGINNALNDYFENGFDEVFFAVENGQISIDASQVAAQTVAADATDEANDTALSATQLLIDSITQDLENSDEFQSLTEELAAGKATTRDMAGYLANYMATDAPQAQMLNTLV